MACLSKFGGRASSQLITVILFERKRTNHDPTVELTHLYSRNSFAHPDSFKVTPKFQKSSIALNQSLLPLNFLHKISVAQFI